MKTAVSRLLLCTSLLCGWSSLAGRASAQSIDVPLIPDRLIHSLVNFKIPESHPPIHNAETVEFLGRSAFHLARGLVYAPSVEFRNGAIDVDMAVDDESRFVGLAFRIESEDEYEAEGSAFFSMPKLAS